MGTHKFSNHVRSKHDRSNDTTMSTNDYTIFTAGGVAIKRFRNPHDHDVLSGRGGSINNHPGNIRFRAWVAERKNDYITAANKQGKADVAREVIGLVLSQNPPGRFLQKDPSTEFWIEVDQDKVMGKTSQALREGAPKIKAAVLNNSKENHQPPAKRVRMQAPVRSMEDLQGSSTTALATVSPKRTIGYVEPEGVLSVPADFKARAMAELEANLSAATADAYDEPKQVPFDYDATPPLKPVETPVKGVPALDTLILEPAPLVMRSGLKRVHSLAFSDDMSLGDVSLDFVNPFNDEVEESNELPVQVPLVARPAPASRQSSMVSDMGGYGALLSSYDYSPRSITSSDSLSDLPDTLPHHVQDSDFTEGMRSIYDALHPDDGEDAAMSSPLNQYRRLSAGGSALTARLLGRATQ